MSQFNTNIGASLLKFTFTDEDGEVVASFRMNPADVKLAQRCQEISAYFRDIRDQIPETATLEDAVKFNDELEDKICYLLGYDAKQSLFGIISATSILGDGNLFAVRVVNKIVESVGPEIQKRKNAMQQAVEKHTAKYTK
ncbi:MAG: hypothetical protein J6Q92_05245 [Oscillospiraceae bacterium]|nr:hypothetical protein [Oscillospiraceae bacterium]